MKPHNKYRFSRLTAPVCALAAIALLNPTQSNAGIRPIDGPALDFSNVEFGLEYRSFDDSRLDDSAGLHAGFSAAAGDILYFTGDFRYARPEVLDTDGKTDFFDIRGGIGARVAFASAMFGYVEGGLAYGKLGTGHGDGELGYDETGFYIEPGVRFAIGRQVELNIAADILGIDGESYYGAKGGIFWGITNTFGFTLDGGVLSDHSSYIGVGVRVNW